MAGLTFTQWRQACLDATAKSRVENKTKRTSRALTFCPQCQKIHPAKKGLKRKLCSVCEKKVRKERLAAFKGKP